MKYIALLSVLFFSCIVLKAQSRLNVICKDFKFEHKDSETGKKIRQLFEIEIANPKYPFNLLERDELTSLFETIQEEKNLSKDLSSQIKGQAKLANVDYLIIGNLSQNVAMSSYDLIINFVEVRGTGVTTKIPLLVAFSKEELSDNNKIEKLLDSSLTTFVAQHFVANDLNLNENDHKLFGFNQQPDDLPTLAVANITQKDKWEKSTNANAGDTVAIRLFFHNSSVYLAQDVTLSIQPLISSKGITHILAGGVASTTIARSVDFINITTTSPQSISFIPGTVRIFKHGDVVGYTLQNENPLFNNSGLFIGNVSPGINFQGTLIALFIVSNDR